MGICLLEATPIRMVTEKVIAELYRMPARVGVFHEALRETEKVAQIPSPTYFRIWKTALIADLGVAHAVDSSHGIQHRSTHRVNLTSVQSQLRKVHCVGLAVV